MPTHAPVPALKKKVLLVVPNMSKRNLRASVLRKLGLEVVCASRVSDARMLWHPSTYDLVLLDTRNDHANAAELCVEMRSQSPKQRIAFLVGKPEFLAATPAPFDDTFVEEVPTRCEENVRQLMTNACEALPRRGGFLEARWRMALARSVKPEQESNRPARVVDPLPRMISMEGSAPVNFGDAVRQAEADQDAAL